MALLSPRIPHSTYVKDDGCSNHLVQFRLENYIEDDMNVGKYFNRFIQSSSMPFAIFKSPTFSRVIDEIFEEYKAKKQNTILSLRGKSITS